MALLTEQRTPEHLIKENEDFSLVLGGPLYQLCLRCHLVKPPLENLRWRIAAIIALTWLPLAALTLIDGQFAGGTKVPFLHDCEVQVRLLFSLPLLVFAETVVYVRMRGIAAQFIERHIITSDVRPAFNAAIAAAIRLRNSVVAEIGLVLLVVLAGQFFWRGAVALGSDTWYAAASPSGRKYTPAGYWYAFVTVPVFQFILIRWYYRVFIWCRLLFQISRLDLNLIALHPDRSGGLGFLGDVSFAFAPLLVAHSGLFAGFIANRILRDGTILPNYKFDLLGLSVFLLVLVLGPLCVFTPKLHAAKIFGLRTYGRLASDYVVDFAAKWSCHSTPAPEPLLGSADIQSLADMANSFVVVREMKIVPFGRDTVVRFLVAITLPLLPLVFTMFSLDELLKRLVKIVL
jgi:hypothetical protein